MVRSMRPQASSQQLEIRRRQAIAMLRKGKTYRWVAHALRASLSSVVRWYQVYRKKGMRGLHPRQTPGRPTMLSEHQKEKLKQYLLKGALNFGYSTDLWTLKRISTLIQQQYGIHYTHVGVWKLMCNQLGWSCQKPERRALQRDEEAIAYWKRHTWPDIKKRSKTWGPSGFPRRKRILAYSKRPKNLGSGGADADLSA